MGLELSACACEFVRRERERGRDKNVRKIGYEENKIISLSLSLTSVQKFFFTSLVIFSDL